MGHELADGNVTPADGSLGCVFSAEFFEIVGDGSVQKILLFKTSKSVKTFAMLAHGYWLLQLILFVPLGERCGAR